MLQSHALAFLQWLFELAQVWEMRPNPRRQLQGEKEAAKKKKYTPYAYDLLNSLLHSFPFAFWSTYLSM